MSVVLGLDTATGDTAVAACPRGERPAEERIGPDQAGRPRHARALLGAIERVVAAAGGWERVDRIAVGVGPGSFTGVRIGVATARALAQARDLPLVGVVSPAALAAGIAGTPPRARVGVIDARRGEVFAAALGSGEKTAEEPVLAAPGELAAALGLTAPATAAGDGAIRFRGELEAAGFEVPDPGDPAHRLSARQICTLGRRDTGGPPAETRPIYLRRPDAERWRKRDRGR